MQDPEARARLVSNQSGDESRLASGTGPTAAAKSADDMATATRDMWQLRFRDPNNQVFVRRATTNQILHGLREGYWPGGVEAARGPHQKFRPLEAYPEVSPRRRLADRVADVAAADRAHPRHVAVADPALGRVRHRHPRGRLRRRRLAAPSQPVSESSNRPLSHSAALACVVVASVLWSLSGAFKSVLLEPTALHLNVPKVDPLHIAFWRAFAAGYRARSAASPLKDLSFRPAMIGMVVCFRNR